MKWKWGIFWKIIVRLSDSSLYYQEETKWVVLDEKGLKEIVKFMVLRGIKFIKAWKKNNTFHKLYFGLDIFRKILVQVFLMNHLQVDLFQDWWREVNDNDVSSKCTSIACQGFASARCKRKATGRHSLVWMWLQTLTIWMTMVYSLTNTVKQVLLHLSV